MMGIPVRPLAKNIMPTNGHTRRFTIKANEYAHLSVPTEIPKI